MSKLLLTFYGDDFTGSTDALEQLTSAGVRTMLFIEPPTPRQLARFKNLQAVGVAGMTRSMTPDAMERELKPALFALKKLGARHVHYKVCSTFDSSPTIGSIGAVMDWRQGFFSAIHSAAGCRSGARTLHDFRPAPRALWHRQHGGDLSARPASVRQPASHYADGLEAGFPAVCTSRSKPANASALSGHPESCVYPSGVASRRAQTNARGEARCHPVRRAHTETSCAHRRIARRLRQRQNALCFQGRFIRD